MVMCSCIVYTDVVCAPEKPNFIRAVLQIAEGLDYSANGREQERKACHAMGEDEPETETAISEFSALQLLRLQSWWLEKIHSTIVSNPHFQNLFPHIKFHEGNQR